MVMCIALHPYIMGQPHRIRHLERALGHVVSHSGVWMATGEEIADWYIAHGLAPMEAQLAAERERRAVTIPREGMDHALYGFSPLPDRAPLRWPGGAAACRNGVPLSGALGAAAAPRVRCAIRAFAIRSATSDPTTAPTPGASTETASASSVCSTCSTAPALKVTVATNASACDRYPYLVDELRRRATSSPRMARTRRACSRAA